MGWERRRCRELEQRRERGEDRRRALRGLVEHGKITPLYIFTSGCDSSSDQGEPRTTDAQSQPVRQVEDSDRLGARSCFSSSLSLARHLRARFLFKEEMRVRLVSSLPISLMYTLSARSSLGRSQFEPLFCSNFGSQRLTTPPPANTSQLLPNLLHKLFQLVHISGLGRPADDEALFVRGARFGDHCWKERGFGSSERSRERVRKEGGCVAEGSSEGR